MQFLSVEQCRAWASQRGHRVNVAFGHPVASELTPSLRFAIPQDAGARVALARLLWEEAGDGAPEALLWITDWGVWPSGEHPPLVEAARRGLGAERALADSPGHLVHAGEDEEGLSVLVLAVLFLWDCWLLSAAQRPAVFVSHDEYGVIAGHADVAGLRCRLEAFGIAELAVKSVERPV